MKKVFIPILGLISLAVFQNCSHSKKMAKNAAATNKVATVSYTNDVLPILQASCTPCHFGPNTKHKALDNYDTTRNNIADIIYRVKLPQSNRDFMPFKNKKPALSDSAIAVLTAWQKQNMPQ